MSLEKLSADTICDLDGGAVRHMLDREIQRAIADYSDRGDDEKERKVTLEISIIQHKKKTVVEAKCKATLPPYRSGFTLAEEKATGGGECALFFQADNPEAPDQPTLPFDDEGGNANQ